MATRDVVIAVFSCPGRVRDERSRCKNIIEELWAGRENEAPIVVEYSSQAELEDVFSNSGGKLITYAIKSNILKIGADGAGRIALIGFSEGANPFNKILRIEANREQLDFVYLCDGGVGIYNTPHEKWDAGSADKNVDDIIFQSIDGLVAFAIDAAQPDPASGSAGIPKRCMVITTSQNAGRGTAARTKDTALRILKEVKARASSIARPCIVPTALLGMNNAAIQKPGDTWPSQWNNCPGRGGVCSDDITDDWPVEYQEVIGNLIYVGFNAHASKAVSATNNEPAHIFQSWWVHRQVWIDVLAPRWQVACVHETEALPNAPPDPNVEPPPVSWQDTSGGGGAQAIGPKLEEVFGIPSKPMLFDPSPYRYSGLNPATYIRRGPMKVVPRPNGLGGLEWCGVEGVFSSLFSGDEYKTMYFKALLPYLAIGGILLGAAGWYWYSNKGDER